MIYFTQEHIKPILKDIRKILNEKGLLILGRGEFYPELMELFNFKTINNIVLWEKSNRDSINNFNVKKVSSSNKKIHKEIRIKDKDKSYDIKKKKLINTLTSISEEEYIEIIEDLIKNKNYIFAYNLINKISDNSLNYLVWKYKAYLEIQLNLDPTESLNKAIFLNLDDDELWDMKKLNKNWSG